MFSGTIYVFFLTMLLATSSIEQLSLRSGAPPEEKQDESPSTDLWHKSHSLIIFPLYLLSLIVCSDPHPVALLISIPENQLLIPQHCITEHSTQALIIGLHSQIHRVKFIIICTYRPISRASKRADTYIHT